MLTASQRRRGDEIAIPPAHGWRTTDQDEINKRRLRAREESFSIKNRDPRHPIFSNFSIQSGSGLTYSVEIRDVRSREFACDCIDFRANGLGTCKHVEATLLHLEARFRGLYSKAARSGSTRIEVVVDRGGDTLRMHNGGEALPRPLARWLDNSGRLAAAAPEALLEAVEKFRERRFPHLRVSQEVAPWLENRRRAAERMHLRREYELKTQSGEWPARDQRFQGRSQVPGISQHGQRQHGLEPAKRQRRDQLRPSLEPREAGTAHCPRLAQEPVQACQRHQSRRRKYDRRKDARHPRE